MQLYDSAGRRKYLTPAERQAFFRAAGNAPREVRTFCETLGHTGCRISEALAVTATRVDISGGVIVLESLKKRRRKRCLPSCAGPATVSGDARFGADIGAIGDTRSWPWSRTTAWRRVRDVMAAAAIQGRYATPKGVRHGFGIKAVTSDVPLNMTQKWLGHANIATTAIYTNAIGPEEQRIAERIWT
jgi:integrase/recombinase XerD